MTQTPNRFTWPASACFAYLMVLSTALGCAAGTPESQSLPASEGAPLATPPIVSAVNVDSYIQAGVPCWPSRIERPIGSWTPSQQAIQSAERVARRHLRDSLSHRQAIWGATDFRTQYFGVTNSNGRRIVGVGIHQRLLDPVRLGMRSETFSEPGVLSGTPIFVCDAGAMQFIALFDEDGGPLQALRFADALHGAPE